MKDFVLILYAICASIAYIFIAAGMYVLLEKEKNS